MYFLNLLMKKLSPDAALQRKDWYLCTGDDFLAIGEFLDQQKKEYDDFSIFEYTVEDEAQMNSLSAELGTISFLTEKRLFIIKGFPLYHKNSSSTEDKNTPQKAKGQEREQIIWEACKYLDESTKVIFVAPQFTKRGIAKEVMDTVTVKEYLVHSGIHFPETIYDKSFTHQQCQFIFDRVGHDQHEYRKAMERLFLYQSSKPLSKDIMFQLVPAAISDDIFICVSLLFQRKHDRAMDIIEKKVRYGESFLPLLGAIIWQAEQMFIVAECVYKKIPISKIASTLSLQAYQVTKTVAALQGVPFDDTVATLRGLAEIDRRMKGKGPSYTRDELEHQLCDFRQSFFEAFQSKPLMR